MKYKLYYSIDFLDVVCYETFDNIKEVREWIKKEGSVEGIEIMELQLFDEQGYYIKDVSIDEYLKEVA